MYRYRYFGAFRFLLAVMVMFQHFAANAAPAPFTALVNGYETGSLAVLVFFALSGFVIAEAVDIAYRDRPVDFMRNRLLRVFPHFLMAVFFSLGLHAMLMHGGTLHVERAAPPPPQSIFAPSNIALNLIGIVPLDDHFMAYKFIPIAWAVRIEMIFYLILFICLLAMRLIKRKISLEKMLGLSFAVLTPLFALSVLHQIPAMFGFAPYFGCGVAWYFATKGQKTALLVAMVCLMAMAWQFLSLPDHHPTIGFARHVTVQICMLAGLIGLAGGLAIVQSNRWRGIDRLLGTVTYPLYMYHFIVLVAVQSLFPQDRYETFLLGMAASIILAVAMSRLIDPVIDKARDRVRGRRLVGAYSSDGPNKSL